MVPVLVIDDTQEILEILKMYLTINGFHVTTVPSQRAAMAELAKQMPDIILLDILLGDGDGRELCKQLKESDKYKHIPVILISASPEKLITYKQYHADEAAEKPFNFQVLLQKIRMLLKKD